MNFWEYIKKSLMSITFKGRSTRKEYLIFKVFQFIFGLLTFIFLFIPIFLLGYKAAIVTNTVKDLPDMPIDMIPLGIYCVISFLFFIPLSIWIGIANLCVSVRRLHDFNYSGWVYFAYIVIITSLTFVKDTYGIASAIVVIASLAEFVIFACLKGSDLPNRFDTAIDNNKIADDNKPDDIYLLNETNSVSNDENKDQ